MPVTLVNKQKRFSILLARFLFDLTAAGYEVTLGEAWRSPETALEYAKQGKGIKNSLHTMRLAIDLNLWKNGMYLTDSIHYRKAGGIWKSYSTVECECCWGGDFKPKVDGNHFSISHGGIK